MVQFRKTVFMGIENCGLLIHFEALVYPNAIFSLLICVSHLSFLSFRATIQSFIVTCSIETIFLFKYFVVVRVFFYPDYFDKGCTYFNYIKCILYEYYYFYYNFARCELGCAIRSKVAQVHPICIITRLSSRICNRIQ